MNTYFKFNDLDKIALFDKGINKKQITRKILSLIKKEDIYYYDSNKFYCYFDKKTIFYCAFMNERKELTISLRAIEVENY